jgi:hypothetical protein
VVRVFIFTVLMRSVWCLRLRRIRSLLLVVSVAGRLVGDVRHDGMCRRDVGTLT